MKKKYLISIFSLFLVAGCQEVSTSQAPIATASPVATKMKCPKGMTALAETADRPEECATDLWDEELNQQIPGPIGTHAYAVAYCQARGSELCSIEQLIHACRVEYMTGGYYMGGGAPVNGTVTAINGNTCSESGPVSNDGLRMFICCEE